MEKYEKEILQSYIDGEKAVLKSLEKVYSDALEKIDEKIAYLLSLTGEDNRHAIYQAEYQKAVRKQIQAALDTLQADEFETVSDYLTQSYNDGFTATMYALYQQGMPLTIPIDHSQVEKAIKIDTKLKEDLYTTLGVDVANLKKVITREISRGVASGMLYSEITKNIANATRAPKSRVMTIVRTEGGRIQEQATMDAAFKAQEKGANVVKQWSAIRDGSTRPTHRQLHNQIRELDKPFEIAGKKAMQPHDFGDPAEDCNCRCTTMIRARWALDDDELERMQKEARDQGLLAEDSKQLGHAQAKNIAEFRERYLNAIESPANTTNPLIYQGKSGIIDVDIDELTPCLRRLSDGKIVNTTVVDVSPTRKAFKDWEFDWTQPARNGFTVRGIKVDGDNRIQGMVALKPDPSNYAVLVDIVEAAPFNNPHNKLFKQKEYAGVGGHLFAEAVRESMKQNFGGYVYFKAKTNLIEHYQRELGAVLINPRERIMAIDERAAKKLYERYYQEK